MVTNTKFIRVNNEFINIYDIRRFNITPVGNNSYNLFIEWRDGYEYNDITFNSPDEIWNFITEIKEYIAIPMGFDDINKFIEYLNTL